jgi:hypothetical protein
LAAAGQPTSPASSRRLDLDVSPISLHLSSRDEMKTDHRRTRYTVAKAHGVPKKRPRTLRCLWCKEKIKVKPQGRLPLFCSASCRQRAYEQSKWNQPHLVALRRDLVSLALHKLIREEHLELLIHFGLVSATSELPPLPSSKSRPPLRVVPPTPTDDDDAP